MKRSLVAMMLILSVCCVWAQDKKGIELVYTEASDLTICGKLMETPNPYHRVDTTVFKGFTSSENAQVRMSSGLAIAFKTNSPVIYVHTDYGLEYVPISNNNIAIKGYDLYIKKDGKYLYASSGISKDPLEVEKPYKLIADMDDSVKDCLLYLPIYSELYSVKIGVAKGSLLEAADNPFRYRIAVFGSSFTQGAGASRPGMIYTAQLSRKTGFEFLNLGCSGNCKLQPYFADVLSAADVDAFLFDTFSNPNAKAIKKRLFPFIERIQKSHPDIPLIFQQTIYRENRNFNTKAEANERAKQEMVKIMMEQACKKYKNVYLIETNATSEDHDTSVDGTHPDSYGYILWTKKVEKPIKKILKRYHIQ